MSNKIISIPVLPHLLKFLEAEYPMRGEVFLIHHKILPPRGINPRRYRAYFKHPADNMVLIQVSTNDSRLYKLYNWVQHIDNRFSEKLVDYVAARFHLQHVSISIREYLALYNITESEYAYETAYKKWQRSRTYRSLRKTE